ENPAVFEPNEKESVAESAWDNHTRVRVAMVLGELQQPMRNLALEIASAAISGSSIMAARPNTCASFSRLPEHRARASCNQTAGLSGGLTLSKANSLREPVHEFLGILQFDLNERISLGGLTSRARQFHMAVARNFRYSSHQLQPHSAPRP